MHFNHFKPIMCSCAKICTQMLYMNSHMFAFIRQSYTIPSQKFTWILGLFGPCIFYSFRLILSYNLLCFSLVLGPRPFRRCDVVHADCPVLQALRQDSHANGGRHGSLRQEFSPMEKSHGIPEHSGGNQRRASGSRLHCRTNVLSDIHAFLRHGVQQRLPDTFRYDAKHRHVA